MIEKTIISLNNYKTWCKDTKKPPMCYVFALNQVKKDEKKNEQPKNAVYLQRVYTISTPRIQQSKIKKTKI